MTEQQRPEQVKTPANARVEKLRGGLEKAVTGREAVIKSQVLSWTEKLDAKTEGKHHNKLHLALQAVNFLVDQLGKTKPAEHPGKPTDSRPAGRPASAEPEDLGEFKNVNDAR